MTKTCTALALACVLAPSVARAQARQRETLPWPLVFVQEPASAEPAGGSGWAFSAAPREGTRIVLLEPGGVLRVLSEGFSWAGDPEVSPDGTRLLFSGRRRAGEPRDVWELPLGGGEARRVTEGLGDCAEPVYMSRNALNVPEFDQRVWWAAFTSDRPRQVDLWLGGRAARHLYARSLQPVPGRGVVTWRTTFNPGSDLSPTMLQDGRVLYSAWVHSGHGDKAGDGRFFLMAMNWAGTGLNALYGAHEGPALKHMATELPGQAVVFVESDGDRADGAGRLAEVSWRRPLRSHRVLSRDGARYRNPRALPDGRLVVARQEAGGSFGLVIFDRDAGAPAGLLHDDPAWHDVDPMAVAPRPEPMGRIATVWTGRFSTGDIQCIDVYDSDRPELRDLPRGTIRSLRVLEALPRSLDGPAASPGAQAPPAYTGGAPFGATGDLRTRILGEIPVMPDGSFHVRVPAGVPFTFQTLDGDGVAVRTMRAWIWQREWNRRSCIGCHEDKEMAPPNRVTQAMHSLLLPDLGEETARRSTDFVHDVMPIVRARCYGGCHGPQANQMDEERMILDDWRIPPYNRAYLTLVPRYVVPGKARDSMLIHRLRGGEGRRPHAGLLPSELSTIAAWIDLGAQWDATDFNVPVPQATPSADGYGGGGCCDAAGGHGHGPAVQAKR